MWCCPQEIEDALWTAARQALGDAPLKTATLAEAIVARSRIYTTERSTPGPAGSRSSGADRDVFAAPRDGQRRAEDLAARALFFTVADVAKVMVPLSELAARQLLPPGRLRIADVGAGVGAMSLGVLAALPGRSLSIDAFDRDRDALDLFAAALAIRSAESSAEIEMRPRVGPVAPLTARYDLILVGSLLNELSGPDAGVSAVAGLIDGLDTGGSLIIIEPALRSTSRALHQLRDHLISSGKGTIFAPCVRRAVPCPVLADPDDWCHEDRPTQLPPRTTRLAVATGLRQHGLKFSYLVVRRDGASRVAEPAQAVRVVSQPRKLKGRRECFACGEAGRFRMRLLKRHRDDANRGFESAVRGDVLGFASVEIPADLGPGQPVTVDHICSSTDPETQS